MLKQLSLGTAVALLLASSNFAFAGEEEEFLETFEAWAVAMGVTNPPIIPSGTTMTLQINITRWSTEEEREALFAQLVENGQEGLVRALRDQRGDGLDASARPWCRQPDHIPIGFRCPSERRSFVSGTTTSASGAACSTSAISAETRSTTSTSTGRG